MFNFRVWGVRFRALSFRDLGRNPLGRCLKAYAS